MSSDPILHEVDKIRSGKKPKRFLRSAFLLLPSAVSAGLKVSPSTASAFASAIGISPSGTHPGGELQAAAIRHINEAFDPANVAEQRYSKDFPALYGAFSLKTCVEERKTLILRRINAGHSVGKSTIYYNIDIEISGDRKNICKLCQSHPSLVGSDWTICQIIGEHCLRKKISGIEYMSARRKGGHNICAIDHNQLELIGVTSSSVYMLDPSKSIVFKVSTRKEK